MFPLHFTTVLLARRSGSDGGSNQNLMLFIRGNAISGAPSICVMHNLSSSFAERLWPQISGVAVRYSLPTLPFEVVCE
jgi:hypothetical protein